METRIYTVVDTDTQMTKEFNSTATTVAELKQELINNGFSVEGKTIQEAITRIEFKDDSSVLPHDVPYKGTTTNNLVFRLTQSEKHVKSGSDRNDLYAKIKSLNLGDEIKNYFGKNFTQVSSADLEIFINKFCSCTKEEKKESCDCSEKLNKLCKILYEYDILSTHDMQNILGSTPCSSEDNLTIYDKEELSALINSL